MIILPRNIRIFLAISTTDKPVNRSIKAYSLTQLNVFALRGFIFRDIHKNKEGVRAIRVMKYKNMWLENLLAHGHLWRGSTQMEYSSQKMVQKV